MLKKRALRGGALLSFLVLASVTFSSNTSASTDITATVSPILQLSVPSSVNISLTPSAGINSFDSATLTATVGTNNMYGYNLSMSIDSTTISRPNAEQSETGIETLTTKEGGYTEQEFTVNKWGYKLTGDNYFPLETTIAPATWTSNEAAKNNTHNITFAAKVDSSIKAGTYSTTLTFTAVANTPSPSTLADYYALNGKSRKTITADIDGNGTTEQVALYKMQDMTPTICSSADESEIQVIDDRDNKVYWILKAKDGKCWMTQNLDHDIVTTEGYYTPDNTDVLANWTPARATIQPAGIDQSTGTVSGWSNDNNTPYSVDPGDWYFTDTWFYSTGDCPSTDDNSNAGCNYLAGNANGKFATTPYAGNGTHGHVGNYYNWSAAVASNNTTSFTVNGTNLSTSICPKGWKLPVTAPVNDFEGFLNAYNAYDTSGTVRDQALMSSPLYLIRGGDMLTGVLRYAGNRGNILSSTVYGDSHAYTLTFSSTNTTLTGAPRRYDGTSIRCVARTEADAEGELGTFNRAFYDAGKNKVAVGNNEYYQMQDMSSNICNAVDEGEEAQLLDNRDNKVYWVLKAKDNHCWMTQNLDHNIDATKTYTPADTDLVSNWQPASSTIDATSGTISGWTNSTTLPSSFDPGNYYWTDTWYGGTSDANCKSDETNNYAGCNYMRGSARGKFNTTPYAGNGTHGHVGNIYNWSAAIASNNSNTYTSSTFSNVSNNPQSSICPAGWRLPTIYSGELDPKNEFRYLFEAYDALPTTGDNKDGAASASPLFFVRSGYYSNTGLLLGAGFNGDYWSSTVSNVSQSMHIYFNYANFGTASNYSRATGMSVRCIAK